MTGDKLKEGLEGLSKMEGLSDFLFDAIYWIAVIFVIVFVLYIFSCFVCYINRRRRGVSKDSDNFLED